MKAVRKNWLYLFMLTALTVAFVCLNSSVAYAEDANIEVSADSQSATLESESWAIDGFERAQIGDNRPLDGSYQGYLFYVSDSANNLSVIAFDNTALVYIPHSVASNLGFDIENEEQQTKLKELLSRLDEDAAKGSLRLSEIETWQFSTEQTYTFENRVIKFDQELKPGEFYISAIGEDGTDLTDADNPLYIDIRFADSAKFVKIDEIELGVAPEGFDALMQFFQGIDFSPLWVTLKTTGTAIIFIFILGLAAAYFSLRIPPRVQDIADSIFTIPMVLPPTVCGFLLLLAFGNNSALGRWFMDIGFPLVFSWQATVLAATVVAFPLMYRSARGAFENLDTNMLDAARTLGWSNSKIFIKLMLPLSWSSIAAGTVLAFARALGEFGATLFLAGNYLGITRTIPIAIYFDWMGGKKDEALFWAIVIIVISFLVILFINLWSRRTTKYRRRAED